MNVTTMEMEPAKAKELWHEYREAVREHNRAEDRDIMTGYKALADGKKILDVHQAMQVAGLNAKCEPKLAICRADAQFCWLERDSSHVTFQMAEYVPHRSTHRFVKFPRNTFGPELDQAFKGRWKLKAIVPSIPPRLRPKSAYENYHILWEADWERVPTDPMLLRHLCGSLYIVLACWDLTELEKAVLARAL